MIHACGRDSVFDLHQIDKVYEALCREGSLLLIIADICRQLNIKLVRREVRKHGVEKNIDKNLKGV